MQQEEQIVDQEDVITKEIPVPLQSRTWWVANLRDMLHEAIRNVEGAAKCASSGCAGYLTLCNDALVTLHEAQKLANAELGNEKKDKRSGVYSRVLRAVCQQEHFNDSDVIEEIPKDWSDDWGR
jgi:hypothetical protein